jgi:hypothetical protein
MGRELDASVSYRLLRSPLRFCTEYNEGEVDSVVICPHCGKETRDVKSCENCGKDLAPSQGVEVLYKDFKVSELLDIKLRKQVPAGQETPEPGAGQVKQQAKSSAEKKRSGLVVTAVIVAVAIAAFFLLRFLLKL